ncbi:hypothetical protein BAU15_03025 [Enterococcus sp. JM4C]|uniref:hypothetical protein n=1 Tax=Candidatus Enterococcus huntleyi TaxID=1857217 RepID=UPI00137A6D9E|nr:hypothetical protein [Enterococcus sp. JM4C]KAF1295531.1 hypothetical protein BAU15_03025 [Enterococcus sp. JM4C]
MLNKEPAQQLISELSDLYNKCLPIYELVTSRHYDETRVLLNTSELFTMYRLSNQFYNFHPEIQKPEAEKFYEAFDEFYSELKQLIFHEDDATGKLYNKLSIMKDLFEELTTAYNVL